MSPLYSNVFRDLGLGFGLEKSAGRRLEVFLPGGGYRGNGRFDPTQIPHGRRVIEAGSYKPYGAFWTSSLDFSPLLVKRADGPGWRTTGHCTCDWLHWMTSNMPQCIGEHAAIYRVHRDARVLRIEDYDTCSMVLEKYGHFTRDRLLLQWGQVSKDFDGVWAAGNVHPSLLYWDLPSTAWFTHAPLELVGVWPLLRGEADPDWWDPWFIDFTGRRAL